jgi:hypothetical protein
MDFYEMGMRVYPLDLAVALQHPNMFTFHPSFLPIEAGSSRTRARWLVKARVRPASDQPV